MDFPEPFRPAKTYHPGSFGIHDLRRGRAAEEAAYVFEPDLRYVHRSALVSVTAAESSASGRSASYSITVTGGARGGARRPRWRMRRRRTSSSRRSSSAGVSTSRPLEAERHVDNRRLAEGLEQGVELRQGLPLGRLAARRELPLEFLEGRRNRPLVRARRGAVAQVAEHLVPLVRDSRRSNPPRRLSRSTASSTSFAWTSSIARRRAQVLTAEELHAREQLPRVLPGAVGAEVRLDRARGRARVVAPNGSHLKRPRARARCGAARPPPGGARRRPASVKFVSMRRRSKESPSRSAGRRASRQDGGLHPPVRRQPSSAFSSFVRPPGTPCPSAAGGIGDRARSAARGWRRSDR